LEGDAVEFGDYKLDKNDINILYRPYTKHLREITQYLKSFDDNNDYNGIIKKSSFHWRDLLRILKRRVLGTYNRHNAQELLGR
jgi:hypothetical protein